MSRFSLSCELERLAALRETGALTEAEFKRAKHVVLSTPASTIYNGTVFTGDIKSFQGTVYKNNIPSMGSINGMGNDCNVNACAGAANSETDAELMRLRAENKLLREQHDRDRDVHRDANANVDAKPSFGSAVFSGPSNDSVVGGMMEHPTMEHPTIGSIGVGPMPETAGIITAKDEQIKKLRDLIAADDSTTQGLLEDVVRRIAAMDAATRRSRSWATSSRRSGRSSRASW